MRKLLVVDDEVMARKELRRLLENEGFSVESAGNGREAIQRAALFQPDLLVMDLRLGGGLDGIDASRVIQDRLPSSGVIFLSAYAGRPEYRRRAAESGIRVVDWLEKPIDHSSLKKLVEHAESEYRELRPEIASLEEDLERESPSTDLLLLTHEVKNVFNILALTLHNVRGDLGSGGDVELASQRIASALRTVDRGAELIRKFHAARPSEGQSQRVSVDLWEVSRQAVDDLEPMFVAKGIKCVCRRDIRHRGRRISKARRPGSVIGFPNKILAAVKNVLQNAIEASPEFGEIHVDFVISSEAATIKISDKGEGIPPELRTRIFEPHFSTKTDGSGLGLSIARDIIERMHSGVIEIVPVDVGSCFVVKFPVKRH